MKQKQILLGITGGIAATKIPELIELLRQEDLSILPVMTESASKVVSPEKIEHAAGHQVYTDLFPADYSSEKVLKTRQVEHIEIADQADIAVVAPATANIIGKLAHGLADDLLTTTLLATTCPVLLCPSMNVHMWHNPVVQDNLKKLKEHGYIILEPVSGMLACGYEGSGRLPAIEDIKKEIVRLLRKTELLSRKTVLVTSGGTTEFIDEVRTISNRSSGKMGAAIAETCYLSGANVILLRAKHAISCRYPVQEVIFETADDLHSLIKKYTPTADIFFHVAAVSDFTVQKTSGKIKSNSPLTLNLIPRPKLYKEIKKINPTIFLATFKAQWQQSTQELIKEAQKVLAENSMDVVIVNDVGKSGHGFETDTNEVIIVRKDETHQLLPLKTKRELAKDIIETIFTDPSSSTPRR